MDENKLSTATKITAILTSFSLIIGIVLGLIEIKNSLSMANSTMQKANETLDAIKVESLSNVIDILDIHHKIRVQQVIFDKARFKADIAQIKTQLDAGKSGEQIYYSELLKQFREVTAHYERLSVLIHLKYLEFDVIFDIIAFPDNFWKDSLELRQQIGNNWFEKDRGLSDFLSGFRNLCLSYKEARLAAGYESGKRMQCM